MENFVLHISQNISSNILEEYTDTYTAENGLDIRTPKFTTEFEDSINYIRRLSFGKPNAKSSKALLLVGATGAGKSSLINSLINKAFGIKYKENFRIKIDEREGQNKTQEQSQTEWITVYQFNHMPGMSIDYNLTIVDTPGVNDTRGLAFDKYMFERLEMILKISKFEVDELHCIGIVTPTSAARLTNTQKYVYDGCMRLFGNNVKKIIHIMVTFHSDASEPQIKEGLEKTGVEYVEMHTFNNSSIYLNNRLKEKSKAKLNEAAWEVMDNESGDFLNYLESAEGESLIQTAETLENRRMLYYKIKRIETKFLVNLKKAQNLQKLQNSDGDNHHESFKLLDISPRKAECSQKALNCSACQVTCHNPCYGKNRCNICKKLSKEGKCCTVCGCLQSSHSRDYFNYVNVLVETSYSQVSNEERKENIRELIGSLEELRKCVDTLKTVALRPIPISMVEYIEDLIENENENNDDSKKEKVSILNSIKNQEQSMHHILANDGKMDDLIRRIDLCCKREAGTQACVLM